MNSLGDGYLSALQQLKKMPRSEMIKKAAEAKRSHKDTMANIRGDPKNYATIMKSNRQCAEVKVHSPVLSSEVERAVGKNYYRIDFTYGDTPFILYAADMGKDNRRARRIFGRPFRGNVLIVGLHNTARLSNVEKWEYVSLGGSVGEDSALKDAVTSISSSSAESDSVSLSSSSDPEKIVEIIENPVSMESVSMESDPVSSPEETEDIITINQSSSSSSMHPYED